MNLEDRQMFEHMRKIQMEQLENQQQTFLIELVEKLTTAKYNGNNAYLANQFLNRNWNKFKQAFESNVTFNRITEHENVTLQEQHVTEQEVVINFNGMLLKHNKNMAFPQPLTDKLISYKGVLLKAAK